MKQGLRLPDPNARIYRKPKSWLGDLALAVVVLLLWIGTFLFAMTIGFAQFGFPAWASLLFAGACTIVVAGVSLLFEPLRRGAGVVLLQPHALFPPDVGC